MKEKVTFVLQDFDSINNVDLPPDSVGNTARNVILHEIRVT